ncbi:unnamed protein product [Closterium sp. NIES-65]|nr:unnamed protein product [Closterium sp. NIES-65]
MSSTSLSVAHSLSSTQVAAASGDGPTARDYSNRTASSMSASPLRPRTPFRGPNTPSQISQSFDVPNSPSSSAIPPPTPDDAARRLAIRLLMGTKPNAECLSPSRTPRGGGGGRSESGGEQTHWRSFSMKERREGGDDWSARIAAENTCERRVGTRSPAPEGSWRLMSARGGMRGNSSTDLAGYARMRGDDAAEAAASGGEEDSADDSEMDEWGRVGGMGANGEGEDGEEDDEEPETLWRRSSSSGTRLNSSAGGGEGGEGGGGGGADWDDGEVTIRALAEAEARLKDMQQSLRGMEAASRDVEAKLRDARAEVHSLREAQAERDAACAERDAMAAEMEAALSSWSRALEEAKDARDEAREAAEAAAAVRQKLAEAEAENKRLWQVMDLLMAQQKARGGGGGGGGGAGVGGGGGGKAFLDALTRQEGGNGSGASGGGMSAAGLRSVLESLRAASGAATGDSVVRGRYASVRVSVAGSTAAAGGAGGGAGGGGEVRDVCGAPAVGRSSSAGIAGSVAGGIAGGFGGSRIGRQQVQQRGGVRLGYGESSAAAAVVPDAMRVAGLEKGMFCAC